MDVGQETEKVLGTLAYVNGVKYWVVQKAEWNKKWYVHQLISILVYGEVCVLDHEDGNGLNNKWSNLRRVTHRENMKNLKLYSSNKSGRTGVTKVHNRWRAHIRVNNRLLYLGSFGTFEEAYDARSRAELQHGFHKNHGKR